FPSTSASKGPDMRAVIFLALAAWGSALAADRVIQSDSEVGRLAFTTDGSALSASCRDGKVRLWDVQSGALKRTTAEEKGAGALTLLSPGNFFALIAGEGGVKVQDAASGEVVLQVRGVPRKVRSLVFSRDRKLVAGASRTSDTGSEETVRLWESSG